MPDINSIPIHVEHDGDHVMVDAVMRELQVMLQQCIENDEEGVIDVHSLPMSEATRQLLRDRLGEGEVSVTAKLSGETTVYETGFAGVWWVSHRNFDGQLIAEQIEVTQVPAILKSHKADMRYASLKFDDALNEPVE